jgi:C1A family cysteine protease
MQWKQSFGKMYESDEALDHAFDNWVATKARNVELSAQHPDAQFGMTKFADLSPVEFKKLYLNAEVGMQVAGLDLPVTEVSARAVEATPTTFDWRKLNAVTPVKNQGQCGSCWAFSTTESVESQWFLANNTIPVLGPQQLVDCDTTSQGCNGGWTYWAFAYLMKAGGLESEASYPYTAANGICKFKASKVVAKVANYSFAIPPCESGTCKSQNEVNLRAQLSTIGPLSICVNANPWQTYSSGVLSNCPGAANDLDHCVQMVGYDMTATKPYYIVRNSWGADWGNAGYIYVAANGKNECGVADVATYAIVGTDA